MKKLAIAVLIVLSATACRRQAVVSSVPTQTPAQTPPASNVPGGATAQEALAKFLAGTRAQDIQAVANVWGTKAGGAAATDRSYVPADEMERRVIIMIRCARNDSWTIRGELPLPDGDRQFTVELKYKNLTGVTDFVAVQGPQSRWYIREYDVAKMMRTVCQAP